MKLTEHQIKDIVSKYPKQTDGRILGKDVPHLVDPEFQHIAYDIEEIEMMEFDYHLTDEEMEEQAMSPEELEQRKKQFVKAKPSKRPKSSITMRLFTEDIKKIKQQAYEEGIPYQTLLSSLIHKIANKKIELTVS